MTSLCFPSRRGPLLAALLLSASSLLGCAEAPCELATSWEGCRVLDEAVALNRACPAVPRVSFSREPAEALLAEVAVGSDRRRIPCAYEEREELPTGLRALVICEEEEGLGELHVLLRDAAETDPGVWRAPAGELHLYAEGYECHLDLRPAWAY